MTQKFAIINTILSTTNGVKPLQISIDKTKNILNLEIDLENIEKTGFDIPLDPEYISIFGSEENFINELTQKGEENQWLPEEWPVEDNN